MKKYLFVFPALAALTLCLVVLSKPASAETPGAPTYEYATIRWGGRENTHLVHPNGTVEMLKPLIFRNPRPDRVDERAFYMNIAMNALAKQGYEFAGMTSDEIVMKRTLQR